MEDKTKMINIREGFNITYFDKEELSLKGHCDRYLNIKHDILQTLRRYNVKYVLGDTNTCINYNDEIKRLGDKLTKIETAIKDSQFFIETAIAMYQECKHELVQTNCIHLLSNSYVRNDNLLKIIKEG